MRILVLAVAAPLFLSGVTLAQSFNVDVGTFNAVPAASFGGAAAQPGTWNQVGALPIAGSAALLDISGAATGVSMTLTSGAPPYLFSWDNLGTFGDDELLLDDGVDPGTITPAVYTFSGLAAGTYNVYTYAWAPDSVSYFSSVVVNGGPSTSVGGPWTGAYTVGVTHALDTVTIAAGGSIVMTITDQVSFATFDGIQLKLTGSPTTSFCDGSGVGTACVGCGNNGAAGNGCANSSFTAGAHLAASGTAGASTGTDSLVLTGTNVTGPGLFFQASSVAASAIPFGDGELCASGGILRLGVVFPSAGSASYPGGLTPNPIHVGGGPLVAGDIRHYQLWYRDAISFCSAATFNLTQGVTLTWGP